MGGAASLVSILNFIIRDRAPQGHAVAGRGTRVRSRPSTSHRSHLLSHETSDSASDPRREAQCFLLFTTRLFYPNIQKTPIVVARLIGILLMTEREMGEEYSVRKPYPL